MKIESGTKCQYRRYISSYSATGREFSEWTDAIFLDWLNTYKVAAILDKHGFIRYVNYHYWLMEDPGKNEVLRFIF